MRGVALHEPLALAVGEIAALAARALGDQHAGAIDAGRVELDELHVLQRQPGPQHHRIAVAGAGVGRGRGEIDAAVAAGREHHRLGAEAVDRAVVEAQRDDAAADAVLHDQVDREIFDEEVGVVLEALLVERVEHRMAGAVGGGAGALGGRPLAHVLGHPAERALVDLAPSAVRLNGSPACSSSIDRRRRLADHIFDRVLVAEPVGALDRIVHVPGPVVGPHVAERCGDPALGGDGVAAGREHLGDAGGLAGPARPRPWSRAAPRRRRRRPPRHRRGR